MPPADNPQAEPQPPPQDWLAKTLMVLTTRTVEEEQHRYRQPSTSTQEGATGQSSEPGFDQEPEWEVCEPNEQEARADDEGERQRSGKPAASSEQATGGKRQARKRESKPAGRRKTGGGDPAKPAGSCARPGKLDGRQRPARSWRPVFLAALRMVPNLRMACEAAQIHRCTYADNRKRDPEFAAAVVAAIRDGVELLHAAAWQRAVNGVTRPIYQGGVLVGHEQVFSDRLAEILLKAHARQADGAGAQFADTPLVTHQTVVMASPQQVLERVKQLSPLMAKLASQAIRPNGQPVNPLASQPPTAGSGQARR